MLPPRWDRSGAPWPLIVLFSCVEAETAAREWVGEALRAPGGRGPTSLVAGVPASTEGTVRAR